MSRVILKGSSCPITVKNVESEILHAIFPNSINTIEEGCLGVTNYSDEDLKAYYKDFFDEDIEFES